MLPAAEVPVSVAEGVEVSLVTSVVFCPAATMSESVLREGNKTVHNSPKAANAARTAKKELRMLKGWGGVGAKKCLG